MAAAEQLRRGETKTERERGRKGVWRAHNFNANLRNKLTVTEEHLIGSSQRILMGGARAQTTLRRCSRVKASRPLVGFW